MWYLCVPVFIHSTVHQICCVLCLVGHLIPRQGGRICFLRLITPLLGRQIHKLLSYEQKHEGDAPTSDWVWVLVERPGRRRGEKVKQGFEGQMTPELCLREQVDIKWRRVGSISSKMDEMKKGRAVRKCVVCTVLRKNTGSLSFPVLGIYLVGDVKH